MQPNLTQAAMRESEARLRLGELEPARAAARHAREIGATEAWMETQLGRIDLAAGLGPAAGRHLDRAVAIEPTNVSVLEDLARAREMAGDTTGARAARARVANLTRAVTPAR